MIDFPVPKGIDVLFSSVGLQDHDMALLKTREAHFRARLSQKVGFAVGDAPWIQDAMSRSAGPNMLPEDPSAQFVLRWALNKILSDLKLGDNRGRAVLATLITDNDRTLHFEMPNLGVSGWRGVTTAIEQELARRGYL